MEDENIEIVNIGIQKTDNIMIKKSMFTILIIALVVEGTGFFIGNEKIGFTKVSGAKPYPVFEEILYGMLAQ